MPKRNAAEIDQATKPVLWAWLREAGIPAVMDARLRDYPKDLLCAWAHQFLEED